MEDFGARPVPSVKLRPPRPAAQSIGIKDVTGCSFMQFRRDHKVPVFDYSRIKRFASAERYRHTVLLGSLPKIVLQTVDFSVIVEIAGFAIPA